MEWFKTIYIQKTKHRKKCCECNKLIQDNKNVYMRKIIQEKMYGRVFKTYVKWQFKHVSCE